MKNTLSTILLLFSTLLFAQERSADATTLKSIDGILKEMLEIISGEPGETRDLEAFRNLFLPTADFTVLNHDDSFPQQAETVTLDEFINLLKDEYYQLGFTEYETGKVVEEYNGLAHVFQSFYAKDSEGVEGRGINSYQLVYFNERWWIVNVVWTDDSNGVSIPKRYLNK